MEKIFYYRQNLKENGRTIKLLCNHSAKFYNKCLYTQEKNYALGKEYITWVQMRELLKNDINFSILGESIAVSIIRNLDINFKNYFVNRTKTGNLKKPSYRKSGFFIAFFGVFVRKDGLLNIPLSSVFKEKYGIESFKIKVAKNFIKKGVSISQLRLHNEGYIVYHYKLLVSTVSGSNKLGLDLGVDNLVSGFSTGSGHNFVISGKNLKFWNYKLLGKKEDKRQFKIDNYFNKVCLYLERYIRRFGIGYVVVGFFKDIKKKYKNRNFYYIPYVKLRRKIRDLCSKLGVSCYFVEESYTSKTCFLLGEDISKNDNYLGYREVRGLYKLKNSSIRYNCDINGAANIICKKFFVKESERRKVLINPKKLKI